MVAPLHGLRSRAIVKALVGDDNALWLELASESLPLIVDAELERFLLWVSPGGLNKVWRCRHW